MLPAEMPVITHPPIVLRPFRLEDAGLVQSVAGDPLIPLITTVPASGDASDARAYIERQHERLSAGVGYSFSIADEVTGEAVGQAGLWLRDLCEGRAGTGYWVAAQFRQRRYATAALNAISRWGLSMDAIHRLELYVGIERRKYWRAAERVGYIRAGLLRSWQQVGNERRDMYMYSLLPEDLTASS